MSCTRGYSPMAIINSGLYIPLPASCIRSMFCAISMATPIHREVTNIGSHIRRNIFLKLSVNRW